MMNSNEGLPAYCIIVVQVKEFQATYITKGIDIVLKLNTLKRVLQMCWTRSSASPFFIAHNSSAAVWKKGGEAFDLKVTLHKQ